jgi:hypothetical protein
MVLDALEADTPTVVVSLPDNDVELAQAAADAGADAVKVHMNAVHRASGTKYGSFDAEADAIEAIVDLDVAVGIVPGQDVETVRSTLPDIADIGIDFVDAFAHHMPPEAKATTGLTTWVAPNSEYSDREVGALASADVDAIELALLPKECYGDPLTTQEVARYVDMAADLPCPVVLPTQLALTPDDAAFLANRGVTNFMLGSIILDDSPDDIQETTAGFIDALADVA